MKHEELEHMTFLVDEKDVEITEVRSSLQENEIKQMELTEQLQQKEERLNELQNELEHANKNAREATTGQEKAIAKIEELKAIIKKQQSEMIAMNEGRKAESEIQSQELGSKTQSLESELQDMGLKLLEVESELEFTKNNCDKATAKKQELVEILEAYSNALNNNHSADGLNEECLKAQLHPNLEKITSLLQTTSEVEDINNRLREAVDGKRLLEEKLGELQTSSQGQKTALEEEMDELRESLLNEKKLVFELEDRVNFAVSEKNAMEAELRRVLEESKGAVSKADMETKIAAVVNSETELRHELEIAKEGVMQLESEIGRLMEEKSTWESLAKTKSLALEEEKKAWHEEMARCSERFEEEKQQLLEQLREISDLKVKESEDFCSERDDKIEELENKLVAATQAAADYERTLEHYQLKLAEVEHERDTTRERLEKQVFCFLFLTHPP